MFEDDKPKPTIYVVRKAKGNKTTGPGGGGFSRHGAKKKATKKSSKKATRKMRRK